MSMQRCEKPSEAALAFYNNQDTIDEHVELIYGHIGYWSGVKEQGEDQVNPMAYMTARSALGRLGTALTNRKRALLAPSQPAHKAVLETSRRSVIGLAGFTELFQRIIDDSENIADGAVTGDLNVIIDVDADAQGNYADDRVHVSPEVAAQVLPAPEDPEEWYFDGELYVRQLTPATQYVRDRIKLIAQERSAQFNPLPTS